VHNYIKASLISSALLFATATLGAPPPKTLNDSGDPTLALTPGLRGAEKAPPGTPRGIPTPMISAGYGGCPATNTCWDRSPASHRP
jgi:hypothetical protein